MPNLPDNGALRRMAQINQRRLSTTTPPHPLPPFLYNNKNNNHENSICLPAPITPLLLSPFHPPAHCLAHSRRRKFIKMKLRLQLTGFIKIYLPLTDDACCATEDKRGTMNNLVRYFFFCVMFLTFCVCLHKYDFSHEILVDYSLLYHNTDLGKLHPDFFFFFFNLCLALMKLNLFFIQAII